MFAIARKFRPKHSENRVIFNIFTMLHENATVFLSVVSFRFSSDVHFSFISLMLRVQFEPLQP